MTPRPLAPALDFVPVFVGLLRRHTRVVATVYGAIAAFQSRGYDPTVRELHFVAGCSRRDCERALVELEAHNWVRRVRKGRIKSRVRYELLGPTLAPANDNGGT